MMRALHLAGLVLCIGLIVFSIVVMNQLHHYRMMEIFSSFSTTDPDFGDSIANFNKGRDLSLFAAYAALGSLLLFLGLHILSLIKIKTTTMLVLNITGIVLTVIEGLFPVLVLLGLPRFTFEEAGITVVIYCLPALAFSIVGVVHAFRKRT